MRRSRNASLPDCVATITPATVSATSGLQAVDSLVKRCITAVERRTPYVDAIPCSICGALSIQDGRDDDGRRHYDETEHDCLLRPRARGVNDVHMEGPGGPTGPSINYMVE